MASSTTSTSSSSSSFSSSSSDAPLPGKSYPVILGSSLRENGDSSKTSWHLFRYATVRPGFNDMSEEGTLQITHTQEVSLRFPSSEEQ
eukprot:g10211.t1